MITPVLAITCRSPSAWSLRSRTTPAAESTPARGSGVSRRESGVIVGELPGFHPVFAA
jgi:hypothetical protein